MIIIRHRSSSSSFFLLSEMDPRCDGGGRRRRQETRRRRWQVQQPTSSRTVHESAAHTLTVPTTHSRRSTRRPRGGGVATGKACGGVQQEVCSRLKAVPAMMCTSGEEASRRGLDYGSPPEGHIPGAGRLRPITDDDGEEGRTGCCQHDDVLGCKVCTVLQ